MKITSECIKRGGKLFLYSVSILLFSFTVTAAQESVPSFETETGYISRALELAPGMTVADVGAGTGNYTAFLADQVGSTGKVYATEVDQDKVDAIKDAVSGMDNVTVILGKHESTELPEQCCDRILLRRVFHHFQRPGPMLDSLFASLKPGGVIAIIDFLRDSGDLDRMDATPEDHEHGVRTHHLVEIMEKAGFKLVRQVEDWPSRMHHGQATDFCFLFQRPS